MGKLKPFLFGTIFGGAVAFVGLQYHLVRSNDGFRMIPRTPQPSVGLAYADIRSWGAQEWADRSELARAMVANGSTDLVATSVSGGLMETISAEGSTLDKLRGLMNEAEQGFGVESSPGDSGFLTIPPGDDSETEPQDLFSVPFEQAARKPIEQNTANDRFATQPRTNIARRELPSIDDILGSGVNNVSEIRRGASVLADPIDELPEQTYSSFSPTQESNALEDMLFGDEPDVASPAPNSTSRSDTSPGMFNEVTNAVQQKAIDSFSRAKSELQNEATGSVDQYVRDRVQSALPDAVSSMFQQDGSAATDAAAAVSNQQRTLPRALEALQNGFDPFVK